MDKRLVIIIVGLLAGGAAGAQAYKWTDEDGVVHYSDRPRQGATEVDLGQYKSPSAAPRRPVRRSTPAASRDDEPEPEVFRYESLVVTSPEPEQTLWNIGGVVTVSLALSPALRSGHQVRVYYDGNPQEVTGLNFQLQEVYRGAHNLQAEVLDQNGNVMIRSQPSRFYVQQTSILRR